MQKQRHTSGFREQALAKAFSRAGDQGIADVASSLHMNTATWKGWMQQATQAQRELPRSEFRRRGARWRSGCWRCRRRTA